MRLLAIETSGRIFSLAVSDGIKPPLEFWKDMGRGHAEVFFQQLDRLLKKSRWSLQMLQGIAVSVGPGSFTGVRVGLSVARALGQSLNIPLIGCSSLDILAQNLVQKSGWICPIIDALRGDVYTALYHSNGTAWERVWEPCVVSAKKLPNILKTKIPKNRPLCFTGDGALLHGKFLKARWKNQACLARGQLFYPRAASLLALAKQEFERHGGNNCEAVKPLYLRPPLAEERWKERLGVGSAC